MVSERGNELEESKTLGLNAIANELAKKGKIIYNFTVGQPDQFPPEVVRGAMKYATDPERVKLNEELIEMGLSEKITSPQTKYTPASGLLDVKKAVLEEVKRAGLPYDKPSEITLGAGGKPLLLAAIYALADKGETVLLPAPYWLSYPVIIESVGCNVEVMNTSPSNNFKLTPSEFENAILSVKGKGGTPKVLILNSPNNPTGAVYTKEELIAIAKLALKYGIYIISDEMYDMFVYDGRKHISIASLGENEVGGNIKDFVITINGASKKHALPGIRSGYAVGPEKEIEGMAKFLSHNMGNPNVLAQWALFAAIKSKFVQEEWLPKMIKDYEERKNIVERMVNEMKIGEECKIEGAFYAWIDCSGVMGKVVNKEYDGVNIKEIKTSDELCKFLMYEKGVVLVPGGEFGENYKNYVRLSFATDKETIVQGLKAMKEAMEWLKKQPSIKGNPKVKERERTKSLAF